MTITETELTNLVSLVMGGTFVITIFTYLISSYLADYFDKRSFERELKLRELDEGKD